MRRLIINTYIKTADLISLPVRLKMLNGSLIIINYHQISDNFIEGYHSKGIWTQTTLFTRTINKLNRKFGFVSIEEGLNRLKNNDIKNGPIFCLTFDDGDVSILDKAIPFLTKMKIPATLFINSAYLDNKSHDWSRTINFINLKKEDLFLKNNLPIAFSMLRHTDDSNIYKELLLKVKKTYDSIENKPRLILDYNDIKNLDQNLFTIGLHNHEHNRLSMLSYQEQKADIEKNINFLCRLPNYKPYWAIPFGTSKDWNRNTIKISIEKDLLLFFHEGGANKSFNSVGLNRISCDGKAYNEIFSRI